MVAALDDTLCKKTGRHIPGATFAIVHGQSIDASDLMVGSINGANTAAG